MELLTKQLNCSATPSFYVSILNVKPDIILLLHMHNGRSKATTQSSLILNFKPRGRLRVYHSFILFLFIICSASYYFLEKCAQNFRLLPLLPHLSSTAYFRPGIQLFLSFISKFSCCGDVLLLDSSVLFHNLIIHFTRWPFGHGSLVRPTNQ